MFLLQKMDNNALELLIVKVEFVLKWLILRINKIVILIVQNVDLKIQVQLALMLLYVILTLLKEMMILKKNNIVQILLILIINNVVI